MISNLEDLIYVLEENFKEGTIESLKNHVEKYNGLDWRRYADTTKEFSRNLIYRSDNIELILISWKKDYSTKYHFHPENGCILKVLEGTLMENIKSKDDIVKMNIYNQNNVSYMHNDKGSHQIISLSNVFSLHIYSPPGFYNI